MSAMAARIAFYPYFEQGGPVLWPISSWLGLDSTQTYFAELGLEVGSNG